MEELKMKATIQITGKKAVKFLGAACLATGVVVLSAVAASGAAVGAVVQGFRSAKDTMRKILKSDDAVAAEEVLAEGIDGTAVADEPAETGIDNPGIIVGEA